MPITKRLIFAASAATIAWAIAAPWTASADEYGGSGPGGSAIQYAYTPSGNITCKAQNYGGPGWSLVCSAKDPGHTARISTQDHAYVASYRRVAKRGTKMQYERLYYLGPFECYSQRSELSCWSTDSGEGFAISRDRVSTF